MVEDRAEEEEGPVIETCPTCGGEQIHFYGKSFPKTIEIPMPNPAKACQCASRAALKESEK